MLRVSKVRRAHIHLLISLHRAAWQWKCRCRAATLFHSVAAPDTLIVAILFHKRTSG